MDYTALAVRLCQMQYAHMKGLYHMRESLVPNGEDGILLCLYTQARTMMPGEIMGSTGLSTGRIATILKRLEEKGLIQRMPDRDDKRRVLVNLTAAGSKQAAALYKATLEQQESLLRRLGEQDAQETLRLFERCLQVSQTMQS